MTAKKTHISVPVELINMTPPLMETMGKVYSAGLTMKGIMGYVPEPVEEYINEISDYIESSVTEGIEGGLEGILQEEHYEGIES